MRFDIEYMTEKDLSLINSKWKKIRESNEKVKIFRYQHLKCESEITVDRPSNLLLEDETLNFDMVNITKVRGRWFFTDDGVFWEMGFLTNKLCYSVTGKKGGTLVVGRFCITIIENKGSIKFCFIDEDIAQSNYLPGSLNVCINEDEVFILPEGSQTKATK